jgi:hypothetical protein
MPQRVIWAIGFGQLVNWGVLYYAFAVLLVPVEQSLGAARWLVAGAFSVGLLLSAAAAPAVGRLADRGHGPALMRGGGLLAAGMLFAWSAAPSLPMTFAVWSGLGLCMAATLYEPVFVIVGRAFTDSSERVRAIGHGRIGQHGFPSRYVGHRRSMGMAERSARARRPDRSDDHRRWSDRVPRSDVVRCGDAQGACSRSAAEEPPGGGTESQSVRDGVCAVEHRELGAVSESRCRTD